MKDSKFFVIIGLCILVVVSLSSLLTEYGSSAWLGCGIAILIGLGIALTGLIFLRFDKLEKLLETRKNEKK